MLCDATAEEISACVASPVAGVLGVLIRLAGARVPEQSKRAVVSKAHAQVEAELLAAVRLGLSRGLSPDQRASWAEAEIFTPPLVAAACYDFEQVVDLLLEHGADPLQCDSDGGTAMHVRDSSAFELALLPPDCRAAS